MNDIVLLSTADWDNPFWTNKQHVAAELARRGHRVLYIDSLGLRRPSASGQDLLRIARRVRKAAAGPRRVRGNLWVWSPIVLPFQRHAVVRAFNRALLSGMLGLVRRALGFRDATLWTYNPMTTRLLDTRRIQHIVYHCVDDIAAQPGMPADVLVEAERELVERADTVFATSPKLAETRRAWNASTHYLPNVADFDHFSVALDPSTPVPKDLAEIRGPRAGFIGAISGYKLDFDLIRHVAESRPSLSVVLIGKVGEGDPWTDADSLEGLPNVHLLGPRPYGELPRYLKGMDVALLPNQRNEYTDSMFPMKFFEYLAAGRPIVSVDLPSLAAYRDTAALHDDRDAFLRAIDDALEGRAAPLEERLEIARDNTYASRMDRMMELMAGDHRECRASRPRSDGPPKPGRPVLRRASRGLLALALIMGLPSEAEGQDPVAHVSPLPVEHWSRNLLHRLAAIGAVDGGKALWSWPLARPAVQALFREASADAPGEAAELAGIALERLAVEFPQVEGGPGMALRFGAGWRERESALLAGTSFLEDVDGSSYGGPVPAPDWSGAVGRLRAEASYGPLAGSIDVSREDDDSRIREATVSGQVGPVALWVGRQGAAVGPSPDAGIVLSPGVHFDGGGLSLPGGMGLGPLGRVRATVALARMERSGTVKQPYFSSARITLAPRPGLVFGLNRAAIFGGEGNPEAVTPWNLLLSLAGVTSYLGKSSGFENQVASLDVWWRGATGGIPWALYSEWGIDDIGFAFVNAPAFLVGFELPSLPFLASMSAGLEHVRFAGSCCGHPAWYRHRRLGEGWTDRGVVMGHPLGGHGTEWALRAGFLSGGVFANTRLFVRDRGEENLFSPDRQGISVGGTVQGGLRIMTGELALAASVERGRGGWAAWGVEIGTRWWLTRGRGAGVSGPR